LIPNYMPAVYGAECIYVKTLDIKRPMRHSDRMTKAPARPATGQGDRLDEKLEVWKREIPGLDVPTEGIVERIHILHRYFDRSLDETIAEFGLDGRAYWLLTHLRFFGPPYRRSPGQLADGMHLSSGAMTNRIDRLEAAGLVRRLPDPDDRRGVLIEPTEEGTAAWERCAGAAARREALIASALAEDEKRQLHGLLRRLMGAFPPEYASTKKHKAEDEE
jgi:DNA-binding MarR family transcriptional regulator